MRGATKVPVVIVGFDLHKFSVLKSTRHVYCFLLWQNERVVLNEDA